MSKKKLYLWTALAVPGIAFLSVLFIPTLANIWFEKNLDKNWNISARIEARPPRDRLCLIFALDGVPYDVVAELYSEGYFNGFYPPGRLVSTFPSLTIPAFSTMLVGGKPFGYERLYYNFEENRIEGFQLARKLFSKDNAPEDYRPELHFLGFPGYIAYVFPEDFTQTALNAFHKRLVEFKGERFIAYLGLSDPIAHVEGRNALKEFLKKVSAMLNTTRNDLGMALDIVLFSDHGNNLIPCERVELGSVLEAHGFLDADRLIAAKDFVLPRNGFVSFAAVYTWPENAQLIAEILAKVPGVDVAIYRSGPSIMVMGLNGSAQISRQKDTYRYTQIDGDPLKLGHIIANLDATAQSETDGFFHDDAWWEATKDHQYPDPLRRIWASMHDLVHHPGTVLVSFADGYAFGPPFFDQPILGGRAGTHGALLDTNSYGVYMTDFIAVSDYNRPKALVDLLARAEAAKQEGATHH